MQITIDTSKKTITCNDINSNVLDVMEELYNIVQSFGDYEFKSQFVNYCKVDSNNIYNGNNCDNITTIF